MPGKFNLYTAWMDPYFYVWAALFAAALFAMIYSIRRYLELKNSAGPDDGVPEEIENPFVEADQDKTVVFDMSEQPELLAQPEPAAEPLAAPRAQAEPAPSPAAAAAPQEQNRAENFVRGIYAGISDLDERMKGIEAALSKGRVNSDFTVKFLEDILQDIDTLDKSKIKGRLEYLLSDLKK